jgi:cytoskeletal protein CcmA (bactofilin family)
MFGSKKQSHFDVDSTIGKNTKVYGNLVFSGGLHIDGVVVGNVIAETEGSRVTISERGRIEGDVSVHHIKLNGEVVGDVHALKHIELAANARVKGNVYYSVIEMAKGAEVNGSLIHGEPVRQEPAYVDSREPVPPAPLHPVSNASPAQPPHDQSMPNPAVNSTHNFAPPANVNPAAHTVAPAVPLPQASLQPQPQQVQHQAPRQQAPQQQQPSQSVVTDQENVSAAVAAAIGHIKIANQGNG